MTSHVFDASARLTPANAITVGRLVLSPVLFVLILLRGPSYLAFATGFAVAATDGLDGYLARRYGATRSGAFLDPLADKVLVLGSLMVLVEVGVVSWVPVALIALREVGISAYRSFWARRGMALPARRSAKVKTVVQEVAVGLALLPPFGVDRPGLTAAVLWVATGLTIATGIQYVTDGQAALSHTGGRLQRPAPDHDEVRSR